MTTKQTPKYYWEDFPVGHHLQRGGMPVSREAVLEFARQFDPQSFHVDEEVARHGLFGGLCASGWHTCSMAMRLMVTNFLLESSSQGSPGLENIKWLKPVFPGDTLRLQHTVIESRPMTKRLDVGLVRTVWAMFNQRGEQVLHMEGWGMFRRRTPGAPQ